MDRLAVRILREVPDANDGRRCLLGQVSEGRQGLAGRCVLVDVNPRSQEGEQWVDDDEPDIEFLNLIPEESKVIRNDRRSRAPDPLYMGHVENPVGVRPGRHQSRLDDPLEVVFGCH